MTDVRAPWSDDQVASLNGYQACQRHHPFTCACKDGAPLRATSRGWVCDACNYGQQDWAHDFMADWSWQAGANLFDGLAREENPS